MSREKLRDRLSYIIEVDGAIMTVSARFDRHDIGWIKWVADLTNEGSPTWSAPNIAMLDLDTMGIRTVPKTRWQGWTIKNLSHVSEMLKYISDLAPYGAYTYSSERRDRSRAWNKAVRKAEGREQPWD